MKKFLLSLAVALSLVISARADYPVLSIRQFAQVSQDSLLVESLRSPYENDTITLVGMVAVPACVDASKNDFRPLLGGLNGSYVCILRDTNQLLPNFAGVSIIQTDTNNKESKIHSLKIGDIIKITVVVVPISGGGGFGGNNFPSRYRTPACIVLPGSQSNITVLGSQTPSFSYPKVTVSQFYQSTQFGQQYTIAEGAPLLRMPVTLENLTVFRNGGDVLLWEESSSTFIAMADLSGYFTVKQHRLNDSDYEVFIYGQKINKIRGYILPSTAFNQLQLFTIVPVFSNDVEAGPVPPNILGLTRSSDKLFPSSESSVTLNIVASQTVNEINSDSVLLFYSKNDEPFISINAQREGAGFTAEVPAQPNNTLIRYYTIVKDVKGVQARFPLSGTLHYWVKDGVTSIADILNPPNVPNSQMARNNFGVSVEGVVTTDTNDIRFGEVGRFITIQDSGNPYSALQVTTFNPLHPIFEFKRGDKVKISGKLTNTNNGWGVTTPTEYEVLSQDNNVEPIVIHADSLGTANANFSNLEQWRGMLVEVRDLTILDTNAKNGRNIGAFAVASFFNPIRQNAFNIETSIGRIRYTTFDTLISVWKREKPIIGHNISWVRGILSSNNQTYSIVPRTNDDFGKVASIEVDDTVIESAYPNPATSTVRLPFEINENAAISIIGTLGEVVYSGEITTSDFSVNTLPNGHYYAKIRTANHEYRCSFTVYK